jgi:Type III restriction enzyme, res subunit
MASSGRSPSSAMTDRWCRWPPARARHPPLSRSRTGCSSTAASPGSCFLVDRNNLGDQTLREFRDYTTPDDGRKFTELYNVDKLTGAGIVGSSKVVISTIQRVYAALRGQDVADTDEVDHLPRTRRKFDLSQTSHNRAGTWWF